MRCGLTAPEPDRTLCKACLTLAAARSLKRQQKLIAEKTCVQCGSRPQDGGVLCGTCKVVLAEWRSRLQSATREQGKCPRCHQRVVAPGTHCEQCRAYCRDHYHRSKHVES